MIFEQEYTIKIRVTGKSTMRMEVLEDILISLCSQYSTKNNVNVDIIPKNSPSLTLNNKEYSFERYINGVSYGKNKTLLKN